MDLSTPKCWFRNFRRFGVGKPSHHVVFAFFEVLGYGTCPSLTFTVSGWGHPHCHVDFAFRSGEPLPVTSCTRFSTFHVVMHNPRLCDERVTRASPL